MLACQFVNNITRALHPSVTSAHHDSVLVSCFLPVTYLLSAHAAVAAPGLVLCLLRAVPCEEEPSAVPTLAYGQFVKGASMGLEPVYKRSTYPGRDQVTSTALHCHSTGHFIAHSEAQRDFSACGGLANIM